MSQYSGTVTISKVWSNVTVEAKDETEAELLLSKMTEAELDNQTIADEDCEVDEIECLDGEEEDEDR